MREYLIIHGGAEESADDPGVLAVMADGNKLHIRGASEEINRWVPVFSNSVVLKETMQENQITFERWVGANKYLALTWFTQDDFDSNKATYDGVKGRTRIIKIGKGKNDD